MRRDRFNQYGNEFSRGQFLFNGSMTRNPFTNTGGDSFADFLTGYCSTCADAVTLAFTQFRATSQAYYIDDTWRATSKLTVTAGLRYEFMPPWYDKSQNIVNTITPRLLNTTNVTDPTLQPTLYRAGSGDFYAGHQNVRYNPRIQVARSNLYGGRLIQPDKLDFAPRLGIAYSPSTKWTMRTGYRHLLFARLRQLEIRSGAGLGPDQHAGQPERAQRHLSELHRLRRLVYHAEHAQRVWH